MKLKEFLNEKDIMSAKEIYTKDELKIKKLGFDKYKKLEDGTYEVWGSFLGRPFEIKVKIKIFHGNFNCAYTLLDSLKGCPKIIDGNFKCSNNKLETLKYGPQKVNGDFDCSENKLMSLKGAPKTVAGDFICQNNNGMKFNEKDIRAICNVDGDIII